MKRIQNNEIRNMHKRKYLIKLMFCVTIIAFIIIIFSVIKLFNSGISNALIIALPFVFLFIIVLVMSDIISKDGNKSYNKRMNRKKLRKSE